MNKADSICFQLKSLSLTGSVYLLKSKFKKAAVTLAALALATGVGAETCVDDFSSGGFTCSTWSIGDAQTEAGFSGTNQPNSLSITNDVLRFNKTGTLGRSTDYLMMEPNNTKLLPPYTVEFTVKDMTVFDEDEGYLVLRFHEDNGSGGNSTLYDWIQIGNWPGLGQYVGAGVDLPYVELLDGAATSVTVKVDVTTTGFSISCAPDGGAFLTPVSWTWQNPYTAGRGIGTYLGFTDELRTPGPITVDIDDLKVTQDDVETYPGPTGITASPHYSMKVKQNFADEYDSFVYKLDREYESYETDIGETNSWSTFSFSDEVTVSVEKLTGSTPTSVKILPSSYGITATLSGNTATFTLDRPRKLSVEFDDDQTHTMFVFADALETDVPDPESLSSPDVVFEPGTHSAASMTIASGEKILYFKPGVHDIGNMTIGATHDVNSHGQHVHTHDPITVYIAGGAYLKGRIKAKGQAGLTIRGRGVISAEDEAKHSSGPAEDYTAIHVEGADSLIEGVTLVESSLYQIVMYNLHYLPTNNVIRNVKMMGSWFGTDGPYVESGGLIEDCFVKVNDDGFKPYRGDTVIRDCVEWQMANGAAFQIGWNMPDVNSGHLIQNVDVIRLDHYVDQPANAVFAAVHGGDGDMIDYLFEDIRVENADWQLLNLTIDWNQFGGAATEAEVGVIEDLTFRNITVTGDLTEDSYINGLDANRKISDVKFQNLNINGNYIESASEGNITIGPYTDNITFEVGTFIKDTFYNDDFLDGDCWTELSDEWGGSDSVEVRDGAMRLLNTLSDPTSAAFTSAGWQPSDPVTMPFTIEYTVNVADSEFGYGGYTMAALIWDTTNSYGLSTDMKLVKETVAWHGQQPGFSTIVTEDQYTLYCPGLGLRIDELPSDGVETITVRQVITETDQKTYWGADDDDLTLVHTYTNSINPLLEFTPMLVGSNANVWNHNYFDLAIDEVSLTSEDWPHCGEY